MRHTLVPTYDQFRYLSLHFLSFQNDPIPCLLPNILCGNMTLTYYQGFGYEITPCQPCPFLHPRIVPTIKHVLTRITSTTAVLVIPPNADGFAYAAFLLHLPEVCPVVPPSPLSHERLAVRRPPCGSATAGILFIIPVPSHTTAVEKRFVPLVSKLPYRNGHVVISWLCGLCSEFARPTSSGGGDPGRQCIIIPYKSSSRTSLAKTSITSCGFRNTPCSILQCTRNGKHRKSSERSYCFSFLFSIIHLAQSRICAGASMLCRAAPAQLACARSAVAFFTDKWLTAGHPLRSMQKRQLLPCDSVMISRQ